MSEDTQTTSTDNEGQQTTATPETQPGQQTEAMFTQADIDRIIGERLKRAKETAKSELLSVLGVETEDEAKTLAEAEKKRREESMSELERLQAQLDAVQKVSVEREQTIRELQQARLNDKRDTHLLNLLNKAHDPKTALTVLQSQHADGVASLLVDGELDNKQADKLVADFMANNAYLFKSGAPGSPTNNNGRVRDIGQKASEYTVNSARDKARRSF